MFFPLCGNDINWSLVLLLASSPLTSQHYLRYYTSEENNSEHPCKGGIQSLCPFSLSLYADFNCAMYCKLDYMFVPYGIY